MVFNIFQLSICWLWSVFVSSRCSCFKTCMVIYECACTIGAICKGEAAPLPLFRV